MVRIPTDVGRPGWAVAADQENAQGQMARRRWRILQAATPRVEPAVPVPAWVKAPEDFVRWLASRLTVNQLNTYFGDLEAIARMSCDLELLRFAREQKCGQNGVRRSAVD